ncbi:MAG: leucine-rich repeat domain-containing protein [Bacteroidota bacterium]|jgi:Leucine-rich repeat (LRR) protein
MKPTPIVMISSKKAFCFFAVLLLSICMVPSAQAQENEDGSRPEYKRPNFKTYTSLEDALQYPDSVFILSLKGKKLTSIPEDVFKFKHLLVLDLSKNRITELPPTVGQFTDLVELDLSYNRITALPSEIGGMRSVRKLSLNRNSIATLPESIGEMSSLEVIELWDNEIIELPASMRNLKHLRLLELRGILLSDEQHKEFQELLPETVIQMSPACNCKTR